MAQPSEVGDGGLPTAAAPPRSSFKDANKSDKNEEEPATATRESKAAPVRNPYLQAPTAEAIRRYQKRATKSGGVIVDGTYWPHHPKSSVEKLRKSFTDDGILHPEKLTTWDQYLCKDSSDSSLNPYHPSYDPIPAKYYPEILKSAAKGGGIFVDKDEKKGFIEGWNLTQLRSNHEHLMEELETRNIDFNLLRHRWLAAEERMKALEGRHQSTLQKYEREKTALKVRVMELGGWPGMINESEQEETELGASADVELPLDNKETTQTSKGQSDEQEVIAQPAEDQGDDDGKPKDTIAEVALVSTVSQDSKKAVALSLPNDERKSTKKSEGPTNTTAAPQRKDVQADQAAEKVKMMQDWKQEFNKAARNQLAGSVKNTMFDIEATLGVAQHHLLLIPYRRLPMAMKLDGTTFDPNPTGTLGPEEVAKVLESIGSEACQALQRVVAEIAGMTCSPYDIPAKLISAAMSRQDGTTYSEKIRLQYREEYEADPEMKLMLSEVGRLADRTLGMPPPDRKPSSTPATESIVKIKTELNGDDASMNREQLEDTPRSNTGKGTPVPEKKTSRARKSPAERRQFFRENSRNGVIHMFDATDADMLRTWATSDGRKLYTDIGMIWPECAKDMADVDASAWGAMSRKLAHYCEASHGSGWIVLCSGDVGNCGDCNHQDWKSVDIYLPPGTRVYILRIGWGINEDGLICKMDKTLNPTTQPNHLGFPNIVIQGDTSVWSLGSTFTRARRSVPLHIQKAVASGKIGEMAKKSKATDPVRYLRKNEKGQAILKPNFTDGTRKLENGGRLPGVIKNFDKDFGNIEEFHQNRIRHLWDTSDIKGYFDSTVVKMIKKIDEYENSGILKKQQFDIQKDWFTRADVEEFHRSGCLENLLLDVARKTAPENSASAVKGRKPKAERLTSSSLHELSEDPIVRQPARKRKAAPTTPAPSRSKKIKQGNEKQNGQQELAADSDADGGEEEGAKDDMAEPVEFQDLFAEAEEEGAKDDMAEPVEFQDLFAEAEEVEEYIPYGGRKKLRYVENNNIELNM
ncbi:hypothetical protein HBH56_112850 [Parastagonospora nodorum]|uniref:Uncharacterized protein n=1 Tax=Phaeosphaeria nodorum (strain SN15 / ATCC MYA-4574 / FGSC 10173) TaxID=321614 RepID=A0A7U2I7V2_PHANO|nr:hypothetical protein HBH56_112850 [Parastagonospora nodorum]QRD03532.1 hypothetical protein JI435_103100 [Parastagonospora nodorum SN15]KAH3921550.1 hypothetical protein HBH54_239620 [Parastagonospora nodorum]KAH3950877.1 hypothetical protein HBH53_068510 [Parastagonospora nodorum]KAH3962963.1 hypothetical protein HBH51_169180 [Parastagonospora nodorum]